MNGRPTAPLSTLLTTSAFLLALAGAACMAGRRGPSGGGDSTGGAGGDEDPGDTGGKTGGYVSPDAASGGKGGPGTGGAVSTGGPDGTGGSDATGGAVGTGGTKGTGGAGGKLDAGAGGMTGGDAGAGAATFSEVYRRIMAMTPDVPASSCWGPCHAGPGTAKAMLKIDMTTKEKAFPGVMKLVVPGKATSSKLYTELNTGGMPEKKPKLPAALIKLVADWINAGAMNN
jgi:hypothetical protein